MNKAIILLITLFLLTQCDKRPDTRGYKEELKDRELMRVTEGQLDQFIMSKGKLIADSLEKITQLPKISPQAKAFIDTIAFKYNIEINAKQLTDLSTDSKAYQILDAYSYNMKNNIPNEDNIQKIAGADTILFTRAILVKDSLWGMWMLSMPKKEMIKRITLKDIKQTY